MSNFNYFVNQSFETQFRILFSNLLQWIKKITELKRFKQNVFKAAIWFHSILKLSSWLNMRGYGPAFVQFYWKFECPIP